MVLQRTIEEAFHGSITLYINPHSGAVGKGDVPLRGTHGLNILYLIYNLHYYA